MSHKRHGPGHSRKDHPGRFPVGPAARPLGEIRGRFARLLAGLALATPLAGPLAGCGSLTRLSEIGRPPALSPIVDPTSAPNWRPVSLPMPPVEPAPASESGLWRAGSRAFFKDQRAAHVGDLVTVLVNITDTANLQNNSAATRSGTMTLGIPGMFGLQNKFNTIMPRPIDPTQLLSVNSNTTAGSSGGQGQIVRSETVTLRIAGEITQVLPNGNMVVQAKQEMRVNSELRELKVSGIVRPQDIMSDNTVMHDRLAEARITYGGRGQLSDEQTPRWGQQVLDTLLPF